MLLAFSSSQLQPLLFAAVWCCRPPSRPCHLSPPTLPKHSRLHPHNPTGTTSGSRKQPQQHLEERAPPPYTAKMVRPPSPPPRLPIVILPSSLLTQTRTKQTNRQHQQRVMVMKGHERNITRVLFNRDGDLLFSAASDKTPTVWDTETGERLGKTKDIDMPPILFTLLFLFLYKLLFLFAELRVIR